MTSVRRRSRLPLIRFVAKLAPVLAAAVVATAFWLDGRWPLVAAGASALLTLLLTTLVFQVDRRRRLEVGAARARVAAAYSSEHERYAAEHRAFTEHLVGLLDAASSRIGLLRHRIDWLEGELTAMRRLSPPQPEQNTPMAQLPDASEWNELWPDLAEAPTVVDLIAWDERMQEELLTPRVDERDEDEPQQRSA